MNDIVEEFNEYRAKMNEKILNSGNLTMKRIYSIDSQAYKDGALPERTKEMLGLTASMVLRCDDCIRYHLGRCFEIGISRDEIMEVFAISNLVGGTIVIPHTRRALEFWDALQSNAVDK